MSRGISDKQQSAHCANGFYRWITNVETTKQQIHKTAFPPIDYAQNIIIHIIHYTAAELLMV